MITNNMKKLGNMELYAKGKRSRVYLKTINGKKVILKYVIDKKRTGNVIKNEYKFLKILNKCNIGPKVFSHTKYYVSCEFIDGVKIVDYFVESDKKDIINVIKKVMNQCYIMDSLGINKKEMHHPIKHIIIRNKIPCMIDFERCYYTKKPKNLTQFSQFLLSQNINEILNKKNVKINKEEFVEYLKIYKKEINKENYLSLLKFIN